MKAYTTEKNEDFYIVWNNMNDCSIMIHEDELWRKFNNEFKNDKEWHGQEIDLDTFDEWLTENDKIVQYINIFNQ